MKKKVCSCKRSVCEALENAPLPVYEEIYKILSPETTDEASTGNEGERCATVEANSFNRPFANNIDKTLQSKKIISSS
jgi:hypothetical protein